MKKLIITILAIWGISTLSFSQVGVGTNSPVESSMLEVSSQINGAGPFKGFMPSRVATVIDRNSISTSASDKGLLVFVNETGCLDIYNGTSWEHITCGTGATPSPPPSTIISGEVPSPTVINEDF